MTMKRFWTGDVRLWKFVQGNWRIETLQSPKLDQGNRNYFRCLSIASTGVLRLYRTDAMVVFDQAWMWNEVSDSSFMNHELWVIAEIRGYHFSHGMANRYILDILRGLEYLAHHDIVCRELSASSCMLISDYRYGSRQVGERWRHHEASFAYLSGSRKSSCLKSKTDLVMTSFFTDISE